MDLYSAMIARNKKSMYAEIDKKRYAKQMSENWTSTDVSDAQVGPGNTAVIDSTLQQCTDDRKTEDEDEECEKMAMDQKHDHTKDREVAMMNRNKRQEVLAMKQ